MKHFNTIPFDTLTFLESYYGNVVRNIYLHCQRSNNMHEVPNQTLLDFFTDLLDIIEKEYSSLEVPEVTSLLENTGTFILP